MSLDFHLLRPLWLLALPVSLVLLLAVARQRRRRRAWEDLVDAHLADAVLTPDPARRCRGPLILIGLGALLLVVALAGPAWERAVRPVYRIEQPRVLLLDLSAAMSRTITAEAAQGATPLERARFEAMDLLSRADEGQVGLIVFGAEPFLISPLTTDAGIVSEQVPALSPELLPVSGAARLAPALRMAGGLLRRSGAAGADVILISVPEPVSDADLDAARALSQEGHRLSVLSIGDGRAFDDLVAAGGGLLVQARLDDADTARLLALAGERAPTASAGRVIAAGAWRDQGAWLLLPLLPLAALAFRRGWLGALALALLVMPPLPAYAWSWDALWLRPDQRALRALADGEARQAAGQLADPRWRAAAHYRAGQYQLAYQALATQGGVEAHYNRGNCLARLGRYAEAAGEYEAVLSIDPGHADARHNRDLLARLLARPEQPARERPVDGTPAGAGDGGAGSDEDAPRAEIGAGAARSGQPPWDAGPGDDGAGPEDGASRDIGAGAPARPPEERSRPLVPAPSAPAGRGGQDQGRLSGDGSRSNGERAVADPRTPAAGGGGEEAGVRGVPGGWTETEQAAGTPSPADYLLRQVPDDPAGLLRARLLMQHLRRHGRLR